jgi:hypothetical protein
VPAHPVVDIHQPKDQKLDILDHRPIQNQFSSPRGFPMGSFWT